MSKMQNQLNSMTFNPSEQYKKVDSSLFEKDMWHENNSHSIPQEKKDFNLSLSRITKNENQQSEIGTDIEDSINNSNMTNSN